MPGEGKLTLLVRLCSHQSLPIKYVSIGIIELPRRHSFNVSGALWLVLGLRRLSGRALLAVESHQLELVVLAG